MAFCEKSERMKGKHIKIASKFWFNFLGRRRKWGRGQRERARHWRRIVVFLIQRLSSLARNFLGLDHRFEPEQSVRSIWRRVSCLEMIWMKVTYVAMEENVAAFLALEVERLNRESRRSINTIGLDFERLVDVQLIVATALAIKERVGDCIVRIRATKAVIIEARKTRYLQKNQSTCVWASL